MTGLIERLEAATGPDRELDAEIWLLVNYPDWRKLKDWRNTNGWAEGSRPSSMVSYYTADGLGGSGSADIFTASIDAALKLVPEGCEWSIDTLDGVPEAIVAPFGPIDQNPTKAATPALAICIAALKARGVQ